MKLILRRMLPFLVVLSVSLANTVSARDIVTWTFGSGSATEPDRASADAEALDQATNWANSACAGEVETIIKTGDSCMKLGDDDAAQYTCVVSVKGKCVTHIEDPPAAFNRRR